ncbi:MAG: hypothetical protein JO184_09765, partial [Gammaproteobacteria bacterium]|nr:hypothetical protein [Gammaproteobacteria bacterium]
MPGSRRLRAVQLAHAAAQIAAARRVWSSVDVLTPAGWARRECERLAEAAPKDWPRLLSPGEEWLLWREATREAAGGYPFLDPGVLAQALQRSSERAAMHGIALSPRAATPEAALLLAVQRGVAARCRSLNAATVGALIPRLQVSAPGHTLLLRGFDQAPPWLTGLSASPAPDPGPRESPGASVRAVHSTDALGELEAIAQWC